MSNFDFIQPSVNPAVRGDRKPLSSPGSLTKTSEPFDQLMERALSPSAGEPAQEQYPPAAKARSHGAGTSRSVTDHSSRRPVRSSADTSEPAVPVAAQTGQLGLLPKDQFADGQISDSDGADVAAVPEETSGASGSSTDVLIPLIAALPNVVISALPSVVLPALTGGTDALAEAVSNPAISENVSNLTADGSQKTASESQTAALSTLKPDVAKLDQSLASELKASEIPAASIMEPKPLTPPVATLPSDQVPAESDVNLESVLAAQAINCGTPAAKQSMQMNNTDKMNKVAGLAEKELPGKVGLVAQEKNLPTNDSRNGQDSAMAGTAAKVPELTTIEASANGISAASAADMRARALERTHDMIALQGVRLVDSKLDSLHVVIKPGAGMQMSLELRQHDGVIDAQVTLERGDFGPLNQHWSDLQQRLEQRGIRLAPLTGGDNFIADDGRNSFQQQQRQREFINPEPIAAGAFAEFALAQVNLQPLIPSPVLATAGRGWETWA